MNRDELLTKLAMELRDWPYGMTEADLDEHMRRYWRDDWYSGATDDLGCAEEAYLVTHLISRDDWLQRRAELINKPSWDDAPEWARGRAQDADGRWQWLAHPDDAKPYRDEFWLASYKQGVACHGTIPNGHDWRQTLERRPITTSLGAAPMTPEEQEIPAEERHDCDRCGVSWWSPMNAECPCRASRSDGSTASYYELPEGATELQDLISYRNLNAQDGEIFRAVYRKGRASHSDALRDAKKVLFYAQAEVSRLERYGQ